MLELAKRQAVPKVVELLPQETDKDLGLRCWFSFRVNNWEHLIQIPCPQGLQNQKIPQNQHKIRTIREK